MSLDIFFELKVFFSQIISNVLCHHSTTTTLGNVSSFFVWKSTFIKLNIVLFINIMFINSVLKGLH